MSTNVGNIDRVLRALLGVVLITAPFAFASDLWANPLYKYGAIAVGLVMLTVAAARICPIYSILGIRTCKAGS